MNLFNTVAHYIDKIFSSAGLPNYGRKRLRLKHRLFNAYVLCVDV